jgi:hypothetical protein
LIGHTRQVCPTFIPTWHSCETSQDDSLHKAFIACSAFRGKDNKNLSQLFRDNLHEIYDRVFDIDADTTNDPEDFYTTISEATEATRASHIAELAAMNNLYLFEFYKILKTRGTNNPYACIE